MIGQLAQIIVVDDRPDHLKAITSTLVTLGSASLGHHYDGDFPPAQFLKNARVIFCDLHLASDAVTSDKKQHYSTIASFIMDRLSEDHGPYILAIWSEYPDEMTELHSYLAELPPGQRPVKVCCLDKTKFIDTNSGNPVTGSNLVDEVKKLLDDQPGVAALLDWEASVVIAADRVTAKLWNLCKETEHDDHESLTQVLGKLALGASGKDKAQAFPGQGVFEALVPLLADQIEQRTVNETLWKGAVAFDKPDVSASPANLNSALHLDFSGATSPTDRGAVCDIPFNTDDAQWFDKNFGVSQEEVVRKCFGYGDGENGTAALQNVRWMITQIDAACDNAQNNPGLNPYILTATTTIDGKKAKSRRDSVWMSPRLQVDELEKSLFCHARFIISLNNADAKKLTVKFRIRSQLLDEIINSARTYAARPGIISLR